MRLIGLLVGVASAFLGPTVKGQGVTGEVGEPFDVPFEAHTSHLGPGSIDIEPAAATPVGNCIPFGNNTNFGFTGFIYRNIPPFTLTAGTRFAFDLGAANDVNIRRNIYFAVANINPAPPVIVGGSNMVSQGVTATSWVQVVTDTQIPEGSPGNNVCGDYELIYTAEAPFTFPGGGLIVGFGGSPPGAFADVDCEQVLCQTTAADPSGFFYARFFFKPDQTLGILDSASGGGNAVALGGIVLSAGAADSDEDGVDDLADNCPDTPNPNQTDGDADGVGDVCDNCLDTSNSEQGDNDGDGVGDCCESDQPDCNANGVPDSCDVTQATSQDCNNNAVPDECDIASETSEDCNSNGIPDECEEDCNGNGVADACDLASGSSEDCNGNGLPDECDIDSGTSVDCQPDGVPDSCDIDLGNSQDCNANGVPDECDIASGASDDCQPNSIPDDCEWAAYLSEPQAGQGATAGRTNSSLCQFPDQQEHGGAYMVLQDWDLGAVAADSFTFTEPSTITGVTWWGTYQDECGEPCAAADDFTLTFYLNDGGPASVVVTTYNPGGAVTRSATGQTIPLSPGFAEYEYSFDLVPPLSVGAGQRHWVEIRNNTAASCMWWWQTAPEGANGNGTSLYDAAGDGYDDGDLAPYDLAFCVSGLPVAEDCNGNGIPDIQDIFDGTSQDCQPNDIPDECEDDRNFNGVPDTCDIVSGVSKDLNFNGLPDEADCLTTPGDLDGDCDVRRDDYALFAACMGASGADILVGCVCADFDLNATVNFDDYLAFSTVVGRPVIGCTVPLADACPDSWTTGGPGRSETFYDFGLYGPIPAGFFGEGSDPFGEIVALIGTPADPNGVYGDVDTQIEHGPIIFDPDTGVAEAVLTIITLDLASRDPITVTYNGGQDPEEWLVVAGLSVHDPGSGELTATLDDPDANSGTYDATVYVQPAFLFVKRQDLLDQLLPECVTVRVLDTGESGGGRSGMPPITLSFTGEPFVRVADPTIVEQMSVSGCAQGNFIPGIIEDGGGRAAQQLTCTSHITPGEAHYFCPPECEGEDVCKYTASGPPTPLGACTQLPTFPQAILGTPCPNGVGQCASNRVKHKPCPGGGSAFQTYANPACVTRESTCDGACCNNQGHCALSTNALCDGTYMGDETYCSDYEPSITKQPEDSAACVDGDVDFTINATGTGTLHYQWKKNGSNVGTNSATLTLSNVPAADTGAQITCEVKGDCGKVTSEAATLTVITLKKLEFTTDHNVICDGVTVTTAGSRFPNVEWDTTATPAVNAPITHTAAATSTDKISVTLTLDAVGIPANTGYALTGSSPESALHFSKSGTISSGSDVTVQIVADNAIGDAIRRIEAKITWDIDILGTSCSLGDTGNHVIYTTLGTPDTSAPSSASVPNVPRMDLAVPIVANAITAAGGSANHPKTVWEIVKAEGAYFLRVSLNDSDAWTLPFLPDGADCLTISKFVRNVGMVMGIPGAFDAEIYAAYYRVAGDLDRPKKAIAGMSLNTPNIHPGDQGPVVTGGLDSSWLLALADVNCTGGAGPPGTVGCWHGLNAFEAAVIYTDTANKKWYFPGGTPFIYDDIDAIVQIFQTMVWVNFEDHDGDPTTVDEGIVKAVDYTYTSQPNATP